MDRASGLDVLIPTFNRENLLRRAIQSLLAAKKPPGLEVRVTVIDNNSTDRTRETVNELRETANGRLAYLFEGRQGKSYALNTAIAATQGDLVGIIDDDEEVDENWLLAVARAFRDPLLDYVGGPYVPRWSAPPPAWLPKHYPAVIGRVDAGDEVIDYTPDAPAMLMGGNCVIRREVLKRVGPYNTTVGRIGLIPLCGEDEDMYQRLLESGARGQYRPDLIIHHYVPPERLTKRYHRQWCYWRGVSSGFLDRVRPQRVPYLLGVPRYMLGAAAQGMIATLRDITARTTSPGDRFSHELAFWDVVGFFYGKHLYDRSPRKWLKELARREHGLVR